MVVFRRAIVIIATGTLGFTGFAGTSFAQSSPSAGPDEPSSRVGRLAYLQGTVSFHDNDQSDWQPALLNSPITAGDALWTEPKARSEVSIAGTRVRMDSATMLNMVALDDQVTRMELEQGRVDIKTFAYDNRQPYEVVTPRGTVTIQQQGDYYVEAGSTQDPTRLGVREGGAQLATANGQIVAVRAGEVVEISGDGSAPQLSTIKTAPPPMPTQWAERDRQVSYDKPPQYLSTDVTGYEDLNRYGTWQNDPEYGQVWHVNSPPAGWAPYTTGRWVSDPVYGWTWVDEQPWGFAPYHYGRWAQRNDRWFWVPPDRQQPAVYAPALVAFMGGLELAQALGGQNRQPVGWFPLGPREVYVPPYSMNRDYYRRINFSARVQQNMLEDRWQRFERREALRDDEQRQMWMNRRFARVMAADDFARSRPVQRALLRVGADRLAGAPVAFIAAPPRPNESIRALLERRAERAEDRRERVEDRRERVEDGRERVEDRRERAEDRRDNARSGDADRRASMIGLQPEPEKAKAPGPQIAARRDARANDKAEANKPDSDRKDARQALPQLAPRNASAPPQPRLEGDRRAVNDDKRPDQATTPQRSDQPNTANRPAAAERGDARDRSSQRDEQPGQANLPPVRDRNDKRPDAPQAGEPRPGQARDTAQPQTGPRERDDDTAKRPEQGKRAAEPPKPNQTDEPKRPDQARRPNEPNRQNQPDEPKRPDQAQRPTQPPKPNQAGEPNRPEARPQAEPAKPQQAQQPQRQPEPKQPAPQQQQPKPERQGMNAPAPQPQPQRAQARPAPQQQAAPQPQQRQQAAPQPRPQQAQRPAPQQQAPQRQAAPQPQPRQQAAPQQAQAPAPQQQAQQPAPQRGGGGGGDNKKND
jgi:hypothetical protein